MEAKDKWIEELENALFNIGSTIRQLIKLSEEKGRKEVVEWVKDNTKLLSIYMGEDLGMCDEWQAKLKDWGIK